MLGQFFDEQQVAITKCWIDHCVLHKILCIGLPKINDKTEPRIYSVLKNFALTWPEFLVFNGM